MKSKTPLITLCPPGACPPDKTTPILKGDVKSSVSSL